MIQKRAASIAYGNGTFVGVGGGFRFISHDGSNWTVYANAPIINQGGVAYGNGVFMTFGTNIQNKANFVLQSTNGTTWTQVYTSSNTLFAAAYGNNTWVFVGINDITTANATSTNWSWSEFQPAFFPACITYGNGIFVIGAYSNWGINNNNTAGYNYWIFSSSDGITWQYNATLPNPAYNTWGNVPFIYTGIAYGNGVFVASILATASGNYFPQILVSSDLISWSPIISSTLYPLYVTNLPVTFGGNQFITSLGNIAVYTSSSGYSWDVNSSGIPLNTLTFGQGTFVVTEVGKVFQSDAFAAQSNSPATTLGISTTPA